ncbi:MAG: biosynthetic-type acetolactate synthase large subunit [Lachnospiraceae bacterium]|nr:biosynthetic-type acetolactate synthase large subunit [Lachnospiraceae bacterium]
MKLSGAEIIIACLKEQGVDTVFGYPGGSILDVYDALYKNRKEITHILTSHEQGAAHAADGYARASGKVGVCFATSGPGATNLVTGIATAYMDSIPLVAITCNVSLPLLGKDSFQEVDIAGITMPVTKHGTIVKDIKDLAPAIRRAFAIARSGRPGPVLVDVTKNVTQTKYEYEPETPAMYLRKIKRYTKDDIQKAVSMIKRAERPFVFVGGGAVSSGADREVRKFVSLLHAPVCDSLMGKGVYDGKDPLYTGMIGMHGTKASNFGVMESDLLIALGARFDDRVIGDASRFAPDAKVLHIDIDPAEINKNILSHHSLVGDLKEILLLLNKELTPQKHTAWVKKVQDLKKAYPLFDPDSTASLTAPFVIREIQRLTEGKKIILTTDVGQHQMWTAQYYTFDKPRTLITSGGLGTMGYGLGAAIGAKTAKEDYIVINITGDGCFRMNMNELATASRYGIKVIDVLIDNHALGMVRQWQTLFYHKHYSATVLEDQVDYCMVAQGLGCGAAKVSGKEAFRKSFLAALEADRPFLLHCVVDHDDSVYPMVAPGMSLADTFDKSAEEADA